MQYLGVGNARMDIATMPFAILSSEIDPANPDKGALYVPYGKQVTDEQIRTYNKIRCTYAESIANKETQTYAEAIRDGNIRTYAKALRY